MKALYYIAIVLLSSTACSKQTDSAYITSPVTPIDTMEEEYTGCIQTIAHTDYTKWSAYISEAFKKDRSFPSGIPAGHYKIMVRFVITSDGAITDVKADNDPGFGLAEKSVALIKNYDGKWIPGEMSGKKISSSQAQPILFDITDEEAVSDN